MNSHAVALFKLLKDADGFLSGERIAKQLGISRSMIWKIINHWRTNGFKINALRNHGYAIAALPDMCIPEIISYYRHGTLIGNHIKHYSSLTSTNDYAVSHIQKPYAHGLVIIAEQQTKGRGRLGRHWVSPKGNIYCSIILQPKLPATESYLIMMATSTALCRALKKQFNINAQIKWPNDILINGKKCAGILLEYGVSGTTINYVIIGVGINVHTKPRHTATLAYPATSIAEAIKNNTGSSSLLKNEWRPALTAALLDELETSGILESATGKNNIYTEWKKRIIGIGSMITAATSDRTIRGVLCRVDIHGHVHIKTASGKTEIIASGDILL